VLFQLNQAYDPLPGFYEQDKYILILIKIGEILTSSANVSFHGCVC